MSPKNSALTGQVAFSSRARAQIEHASRTVPSPMEQVREAVKASSTTC